MASGGHNRDAVLLLRNVDKEVKDKVSSIINVTPSILDLFGIPGKKSALTGRGFF
jgi:predicted AlkP superfamily phosphohydrolase/phosphomutase